jgi:hypothetical protein
MQQKKKLQLHTVITGECRESDEATHPEGHATLLLATTFQ